MLQGGNLAAHVGLDRRAMPRRAGCLGASRHLVRCALRDHPTLPHHDHPVAEVADHFHVVLQEKHGHSVLAQPLPERRVELAVALTGTPESRALSAIGGVLAVLAGIVCLRRPGESLLVLVIVLGLYLVASGLIHFLRAFSDGGNNRAASSQSSFAI